jgi:hypothetical protein
MSSSPLKEAILRSPRGPRRRQYGTTADLGVRKSYYLQFVETRLFTHTTQRLRCQSGKALSLGSSKD